MSLTSTGSRTITDASNNPIEGVVVIARLRPVSGAVRVDDMTEMSGESRTITDASGYYEFDFERNGNLTPANTYYEIEERIPRKYGGTVVWAIVVGASDFNIAQAGITTQLPANSSTPLTLEAGDLRYLGIGDVGNVVLKTGPDQTVGSLITFTPTTKFANGIQIGAPSGLYPNDGALFYPVHFPVGQGMQLESIDPVGGTGLVIAPGVNADENLFTSQILIYGKTGTDYNRFGITNFGHGLTIDSTYNGAGAARPIAIYTDGSVSNAKAGIEALRLEDSGTLFLNGGAPTIDGKAYTGRTRISDRYDTGAVKLILQTRTVSGTSNVADSALIDFYRGSSRKAGFGLNYGGDNVDAIDFVNSAGTVIVQFRQDVDLYKFGKNSAGSPEMRLAAGAGGSAKFSFYQNGVERGFLNMDASQNLRLDADGATVDFAANNTIALELQDAPADGQTAMLVRRNVGGSFSLQRVTMGVADSGGVGFKLLRVAN